MQNDEVIFLAPGQGRSYQAGPMFAVFKADGDETGDAYCVSEWWLEPGDEGPGAHLHDFANRGSERAGALNVFIPGGFEPMMPRIVAYFEGAGG